MRGLGVLGLLSLEGLGAETLEVWGAQGDGSLSLPCRTMIITSKSFKANFPEAQPEALIPYVIHSPAALPEPRATHQIPSQTLRYECIQGLGP